MKKSQVLYNALNQNFRTAVPKAFKKEFGIEIETSFNLVIMAVVSGRTDNKPLTKTQLKFLKIYEDGYTTAMTYGVTAIE